MYARNRETAHTTCERYFLFILISPNILTNISQVYSNKKMRRAPTSSRMSVCTERLCSHFTDFREMLYRGFY